MRQIREIQPTGLPVDALFSDHPAKYTVDGCLCDRAHTLEEAEDCQDGRCPILLRAVKVAKERYSDALEADAQLEREAWDDDDATFQERYWNVANELMEAHKALTDAEHLAYTRED